MGTKNADRDDRVIKFWGKQKMKNNYSRETSKKRWSTSKS